MAKTPKAVALGSALRQARHDKGIKLRDFATHISRDPAMLSRWESGERSPKPEQVARILALLGVTGQRYDDVMTLVHGTSATQWVATTLPEQRQQMAAFIEYEKKASSIIAAAPMLIPGLLQTPDYTRAIMSAAEVPEDEIANRVVARAARQEVITKPLPATLLALIGEPALYLNVGGASVVAEQLSYLLEMSRLANVEVRVVPLSAGWHPGVEGAFDLMDPDGPARSAFVETRRTILWLHQLDDVKAYKRAADKIARLALNPFDSMRCISRLIARMETSP
ncbi:helix-turn-helix domain-containing protein [Actinokineospora sp. 24-640]